MALHSAGIEMDSDAEDEEVVEVSVKDQLLSQLARIIGLKKRAVEVEDSKPQNASKYS